MLAGMRRSSSSPSSQFSVLMLKSIVREALVTSVMCVESLVSCHTSQLSIVPKASLPASALARAPGTHAAIELFEA